MSSSGSCFLFDVGLGASGSGGCPKTRPAAAAARAVPDPTSCKKRPGQCWCWCWCWCASIISWRERVSRGKYNTSWNCKSAAVYGVAQRDGLCLCSARGALEGRRIWGGWTYTRHDLHLGCGLLCRRRRRRRQTAVGGEEDKRGFGIRKGRGLHRQDITKIFEGGNEVLECGQCRHVLVVEPFLAALPSAGSMRHTRSSSVWWRSRRRKERMDRKGRAVEKPGRRLAEVALRLFFSNVFFSLSPFGGGCGCPRHGGKWWLW